MGTAGSLDSAPPPLPESRGSGRGQIRTQGMAGCGSHSSSWGRVLRVPLSGGKGAEEQALNRSRGASSAQWPPWPCREGGEELAALPASLLQLLLPWSSPGGVPRCRPEQAGTLPWSPGPPGAFIQEGPDQDPARQLLRRPCVWSTHLHHCFPPTPRVTDGKTEAQGGKGFP